MPGFFSICSFSFSPPADIISTVEFNHDGELLATGDKGGRVVIFQREEQVGRDWVTTGDMFANENGSVLHRPLLVQEGKKKLKKMHVR